VRKPSARESIRTISTSTVHFVRMGSGAAGFRTFGRAGGRGAGDLGGSSLLSHCKWGVRAAVAVERITGGEIGARAGGDAHEGCGLR
jgi:hypothetical protein